MGESTPRTAAGKGTSFPEVFSENFAFRNAVFARLCGVDLGSKTLKMGVFAVFPECEGWHENDHLDAQNDELCHVILLTFGAIG
jgi:hypothetical protein